MERQTIKANEGMWLTDGNVFAKEISLGDWDKAENYHEITEEEYLKLTSEVITE